jgi:two-component system, cell cycle response regulator
MSGADVADAGPTVERGVPRLTSKVFTDLLVWMAGFGLVIGVAFPPAIVRLGVPPEHVLRPRFFAATVTAGLFVGGMNLVLARSVVGRRLRQLTDRMRYVSGVLEEANYTGDWSRCSPDECELEIDSADELGDAAGSFNQLLHALAGSRRVEQALGGYARTLATHLELDTLAEAALHGALEHAGAQAGALLVVVNGDLRVQATHRMDGSDLPASSLVSTVLRSAEVEVTALAHDLVIDAAAVSFRPAAVAVAPIRFKDVPVGAFVLAFARTATPDRIRLLSSLRDPTGVALNNALAHERFQRLAAVDPLTGVYNRRYGAGRLQEEFARALRSGSPLGLLAFDLDHFKAINDAYGHLVGDQVLRDVTSAARLALRDGDVLVRTGGEEFLVLLPGAGVGDVEAIGERLRRCVASVTVATGEGTVNVTVSVGGVSFPRTEASGPDDLLDRADQAVYRSKELGRDRLTMCHEGTPRAVPA